MKYRLLFSIILSMALGQLAFAGDLRAEVVQQLRRDGSNVAKPHRFDFYLYLPSEGAAQAAAQRLREQGLVVQVRRAAKGSDWLCFASARLIPDTPELTGLGQLFESLARANGGVFDGWEAEVVK